MKTEFLEALEKGILIFDGAMGTEIQNSDVSEDDFRITSTKVKTQALHQVIEKVGDEILEGCNEILNFTRPDVIKKIHESYLDAGADLIDTNTFGSTSIVLGEYNIQELDYEVSFYGAKLAKEAVEKYSTAQRPRFVVGGLGPGTKLISLGQTTWDQLEDTYSRSFQGLIEGGADVLLLETLQDLLMVKAGIISARNAMERTGIELPLIVQITLEQTGTMLVGSELSAALNMLEAFPEVQVVGMNCATGPEQMMEYVRFLGENSTRPIVVQPNAGLPVMEGGKAIYKLSPEELANYHEKFVDEYGVAICGGCCGTTPAHIRAIAARLSGRSHQALSHWHRVKKYFPGFDFNIKTQDQASALKLKGCSSLYQFVPYEQENSFLIIGEKTNANGSKAFREMLGAENWEGLIDLAKELEREGSHVLDVCTAYVGRDEVRDMGILLSRYNRHITIPMMIDSTEVPVIEKGLQNVAGKPIVNSINFEDGGERLHQVLNLCRKYGAAVVGLTIDENGMAKEASEKVRIAERMIEQTRAYGIPDHDVFIDTLTFTLGSGDEEFRKAGIETIKAISDLKERCPYVNTILGLSNISFGLKPAARQVLNSVFLACCQEAGLTSAIVHFSKIKPKHKIEPEIWKIAADLVYDKRIFELEKSEEKVI